MGRTHTREVIREVGPSKDELARIRQDVANEKRRADDLAKIMGERRGEFKQMQQTIAGNEQRRAAEQRRMAAETERVRAQYAADSVKQAAKLTEVRKAQESRIAEMDSERKKDKEAFQTQMEALKKDGEEKVKLMSVEKLKDRIGFLLPFVRAERGKLEAAKAEYSSHAEAVALLQIDILKEEKRLGAFLDLRHAEHCLRIVLYGSTGHGKSSTGCRLVGDTSDDFSKGGFPVSHSLDSETQTIKAKLVTAADSARLGYAHSILVVDLPGTGDTGGVHVDERHSNRMTQYLKGIGFINVIALIHNGSLPRLEANTIQMLDALNRTFGAEIWSHVVIVVTHIRQDFGGDAMRAQKAKEKAEKWVARIQAKIRELYSLPEYVELSAVCIDNTFVEGAALKCRELVNTYAGRYKYTAFKCDALVSPLDAWRCQLQLKQNAQKESGESVSDCIDGSNAAIAQIKRCKDQMEEKGGETVDLFALCDEFKVDADNLAELSLDDVLLSLDASHLVAAYIESEETRVAEIKAAAERKRRDEEETELAKRQSLATAGASAGVFYEPMTMARDYTTTAEHEPGSVEDYASKTTASAVATHMGADGSITESMLSEMSEEKRMEWAMRESQTSSPPVAGGWDHSYAPAIAEPMDVTPVGVGTVGHSEVSEEKQMEWALKESLASTPPVAADFGYSHTPAIAEPVSGVTQAGVGVSDESVLSMEGLSEVEALRVVLERSNLEK